MQGRHIQSKKSLTKINIEKLIPKNHFLRKLDDILDLSFVRELTTKFYCYKKGRPSIDPELFFRITLIGYIFNIKSNRKLCEEIKYNLAYRWYCKLGINDRIPDHSSLSKIRLRYGNKVFEVFFDTIILLCKEYGLIKGNTIITDATLIQANASIDSMVSMDYGNAEDSAKHIGVITSFSKRKLSNKSYISKTDPDSSLSMKAGAARTLKYKVHISIDKDSRIILDSKVTTGSYHETQIYLDRLFYIKSKYNLEIDSVIADRGYGSSENIKYLQEQNITGYIPLFSRRSGQIQSLVQQGFKYNKDKEEYICPTGIVMKGWKSGDRMIYKISDNIW